MPSRGLSQQAGNPAATSNTAAISIQALSVRIGARDILHDISTEVSRGSLVALCGANGSGKSTLLRCLAGLQDLASGRVALAGTPLAAFSRRALARELAHLSQSSTVPPGLSVRELASFGRYPHLGLLKAAGRQDRRAVDWALEMTGMLTHADRQVDHLSGGERQRVWIAMALAQDSRILLLDEPTTYLDLQHQIELLSLVRSLSRERGLTVVWVLHDLNQASAFSDRILLLRHGRIHADGSPDKVIEPHTIEQVFGLKTLRVPHPLTGTPFCLPADLPAAPSQPIAQ